MLLADLKDIGTHVETSAHYLECLLPMRTMARCRLLGHSTIVRVRCREVGRSRQAGVAHAGECWLAGDPKHPTTLQLSCAVVVSGDHSGDRLTTRIWRSYQGCHSNMRYPRSAGCRYTQQDLVRRAWESNRPRSITRRWLGSSTLRPETPRWSFARSSILMRMHMNMRWAYVTPPASSPTACTRPVLTHRRHAFRLCQLVSWLACSMSSIIISIIIRTDPRYMSHSRLPACGYNGSS